MQQTHQRPGRVMRVKFLVVTSSVREDIILNLWRRKKDAAVEYHLQEEYDHDEEESLRQRRQRQQEEVPGGRPLDFDLGLSKDHVVGDRAPGRRRLRRYVAVQVTVQVPTPPAVPRKGRVSEMTQSLSRLARRLPVTKGINPPPPAASKRPFRQPPPAPARHSQLQKGWTDEGQKHMCQNELPSKVLTLQVSWKWKWWSRLRIYIPDHVRRWASNSITVVQRRIEEGEVVMEEAAAKLRQGLPLLPGQNLKAMHAKMAECVAERTRLLKTYRMWRSKGGGAEFVPYHKLHWVARKFARLTKQERAWLHVSKGGRMKRGPPCPRNCEEWVTCNGDVACPLYQEAAIEFGEGSEEFCRFLLKKGPFHPNSRFATMKSAGRDTRHRAFAAFSDEGTEKCLWSEGLALRLHGRSPL
ncbi:lig4 [Symbiodinium microadriaticum]|nr:lig4 [Symbiodinium microadriaticum]CAE7841110.1 lig4 [Symbiodinium sp. KB8]